MSDHEEIVKELRELARNLDGGYGAIGNPFKHMYEAGQEVTRAADYIEQQHQEIERRRELWAAIFALGSTFGGGRHYNEWVALRQQMQALGEPS